MALNPDPNPNSNPNLDSSPDPNPNPNPNSNHNLDRRWCSRPWSPPLSSSTNFCGLSRRVRRRATVLMVVCTARLEVMVA